MIEHSQLLGEQQTNRCLIFNGAICKYLREAHVEHAVACLVAWELDSDKVHGAAVELLPVGADQLLLQAGIVRLAIAVDVRLSLHCPHHIYNPPTNQKHIDI